MNGTNNQTTAPKRSARKKGRFNIIDFLLIVVILLLVAALIYVFLPTTIIKSITADTTKNIQYTIEIIGVEEKFLDNIRHNDNVLDSTSKNSLGKVHVVDIGTPYTQLEYVEDANGDGVIDQSDGNGKAVLSPIDGKYNVKVTIAATADFESGVGYTVNGTRIAVGEKICASFPDYLCEAYCISIMNG